MRPRRRIVLLFGAGIVLPSLLLGYLAFRGIRNDRALVEKERLEETRRAADRILEAVDEKLTTLEAALSKTLEGYSGATAPGRIPSLEKLAAGNPLVEQFFSLKGSKEIRFPIARLLYVPDARRDIRPASLDGPDLSAEFRNAESLEFRDKNYQRALAAYRKILGNTRNTRTTVVVLNAVARVQKKSGLLKDALSTYEVLVHDHGEELIPGGLPLGPSASLEICAISRELEDYPKSLRSSLDLYRSLIRPEWILEQSEFELFVQRSRSLIEEILSVPRPGVDSSRARKEFQDLGAEETVLRKATERMALFARDAAPILQAKLDVTDSAADHDRKFARLALDIRSLPYLVSIERPGARTGGSKDEAWGVIIDAERLRENVLLPALRDRFPSGDVPWSVRGRNGEILLSSGNPPPGPAVLSAKFAANFPYWTLEFHQPPAPSIRTFLFSRHGLYSFVFLLIAGILLFGLILTVRSVSHELELARMKSDFVSTVSHEFKSPLTSIRQISEMLQAGRVPSEARRQTYYDVLLEQSERLSLLTDNILGLAKIEEGRAEFKFEPTDIAVLLTDVVSSFRERVRHEGFEIGLKIQDSLPLLTADRTALSQAVANLIDNAVKYSGDSRKVAVGASLDETAVAVSVRDFGIGIKKEDRDQVFDRFFRGGDELTRAVKGSGLGLTLVRKIVEAHGGSVRLESEPGKGSVFTIRLPIPQRRGGEK
jgi:signal transduction histidine kinase/tetratricopeptide (TPR) repeat protein